jgi:hypothetical protein
MLVNSEFDLLDLMTLMCSLHPGSGTHKVTQNSVGGGGFQDLRTSLYRWQEKIISYFECISSLAFLLLVAIYTC